MPAYREIHIATTDEEQREVLIALLEGIGFDSFAEYDAELVAYVPDSQYHPGKLGEILASVQAGLVFSEVLQEEKNWNEEWEKNYPPVLIADRCYIRAPFHPERKDVPHEIIIEPRMAFGTAHHETTAMMIEWLLEMDVNGKILLDMGCGTGVLAILANKLGALDVMAVDNDEWACRNSQDNVLINRVSGCHIVLGDVSAISGKKFDVILANINRNILIRDIPEYIKSLLPGGTLVISGFYKDDTEALSFVAKQYDMELQGMKSNTAWASLLFRKTWS
jgi:ribosomal protein L11 methyltransferase